MEIRPGPGSFSLQVAPASLPSLTRAWSAGQTLEALVLRADPARGTVLLQLPEGQVEARTEIPLQPGSRLLVVPEASEDGTRLLLRVQGDGVAAQTRLAALRQALPRAAPLAPLFEVVDQLLKSPPGAVPAPIRLQAQALADARPTPERLTTPEGLRTALRNSGMELEAHLADPSAPPPSSDLKGRLFALLAALADAPRPLQNGGAARTPTSLPDTPLPDTPLPDAQPPDTRLRNSPQTPAPQAHRPAPNAGPAPLLTSPEDLLGALTRHAEGATARILLHQLQALPDTQPSPQWSFDLPVRTPQGTETLHLRFERDPPQERNGATTPPGWRVTLDLSTPAHGALRALVTWRGGEISTRFFAERETTAETFRNHIQQLGQRLAAAGIPVGTLETHAGIPADAPRTATSLLSERA